MSSSDSDETIYEDPNSIEYGQRMFPSQDFEECKDSLEVTKLKAENDSLKQEAGHLEWHVGVYHLALEKLPHALPVYHEAFREFRSSPECPQCTIARLLGKINELEKKIEILETGRSTSPILTTLPKQTKNGK